MLRIDVAEHINPGQHSPSGPLPHASPFVAQLTKTSIAFEVPLIEAVIVSVAVMVWVPVVCNVVEKVPIPSVSVEFAGSVAFASVLEKCTVPA